MSAPEISIPVEVVDAAINGWFSNLPDGRDQQEHFRIRMRAALAAAGYTAAPAAGDARDAAQVARWKRDSELLMAIQESCWDVRFLGHSNGDDCDISIEIVGHYMAAPHERVMGENYTENLRAALEQALTADAYPPARPEYDEWGHPVIRAASQQQEG